MTARRKKQRRIRDLRTLTRVQRITPEEANAIGAVHGLGPVAEPPLRMRLPRPPAGPWAQARVDEARAAR